MRICMATLAFVLGGIGLFLLGMSLMTDGLKSLAGDALKQLLSKFTGGTFTSILTGTTITAFIQSSSATTFMTIGFVSAGLLTFTQSVGVIIGANLGSTSTGWIVSLVGFKVNMTAIALPLIGIGVFLKLISKGRFSSQGMVLAGFGLLFLGIDVLQQGMADFGELFQLGGISSTSLWNKLLLVMIGFAMTVVMQSSSAAVVTTLTALYAGAITFDQAAILVIGQNVGTTLKALLASIGSSTPAKRTAAAHIMFNIVTGIVAFMFLPFIIQFVYYLSEWLHIQDLAISLAIFHTVFNLIGIILVVIFIQRFIRFIEKIIPDRGNPLTKYLDESVATVPAIAMEAVRRTLIKIAKIVVQTALPFILNKDYSPKVSKSLEECSQALEQVRIFLSKINFDSQADSKEVYSTHLANIHALDHLTRLIKVLMETEYLQYIHEDNNVRKVTGRLIETLQEMEKHLSYEKGNQLVELAETNSKDIAEIRREDRKNILKTSAKSEIEVNLAIQMVHSIHWMDRLAYHLWRTTHYLYERED